MKNLRLGHSKKLFGVCSGFAEYFDCDPVMVRLIMIIAVLCSCGYATAFYILCAIFMDKPLPEDAYFSNKDDKNFYKNNYQWVNHEDYEEEQHTQNA